MAILSDNNRIDIWAEVMREMSSNNDTISFTKQEFRAAINAIDQWVDDNAASFNAAIPQPVRGALTAKQKAGLLNSVIQKRFKVI